MTIFTLDFQIDFKTKKYYCNKVKTLIEDSLTSSQLKNSKVV